MNNAVPNQGMRCIKEIVNEYIDRVEWDVFDVRAKGQVPGTNYDIYISSGGPGHPLDGDGDWDNRYYALLDALWAYNQNPANVRKKHVFFICHSFQMATHHFGLAQVANRIKRSFGVMPVFQTEAGLKDEIFENLGLPFYAVDVRDYQMIEPDEEKIVEMGASILAIEQERDEPHLPRAIMAVRFSNEFFGTQFHPEADADGMSRYYQLPEKRKETIDTYGEAKYQEIIEHLNDPDKVELTRNTVIPTFLTQAIKELDAAFSHAV
jgi:GMP synthase-like glutamine amidotransferase